MNYSLYKVGGCVRDKLLGLESNDIDYVFVINDISNKTIKEGWEFMKSTLINSGFKIFLETEDSLTIRARFPKDHINSKLVCDFVLARKEGYNRGQSRKPTVELGTLEDDLRRRDFTVNALAEDENGNIIDLFGGINDLKYKILKTPINTKDTFLDDPLRLIRAFRFSITKDFYVGIKIRGFINNLKNDEEFFEYIKVVSDERIVNELYKCFKFDTYKTLLFFNKIGLENPIIEYIFNKVNFWLKPTNKLK